jgi:lysyl endopeptidase
MIHRLLTAALLLLPAFLNAQKSLGGVPFSLRTENAHTAPEPSKINISPLPALDFDRVRREDAKSQEQIRFAAPVSADIAPDRHGVWTVLPNGDRLWQCRVRSAGALGLILQFDRFILPEGSRFFAFSPDGRHVEGAFSQESCLGNGRFLVGVLPGETAVLEYWEPAGTPAGAFQMHLNRADCVYDRSGLAESDFQGSYSCNINVNCPSGTPWQTEKRGIARILMTFSNGTGWCTGSLVANTSGSFDPFFLSAHHCQLIGLAPDFPLWRFDFDYEAPGCSRPATEPGRRSVLGCERLAFRAETDMLLLRLNPLPTDYSFYFNGWDRGTATSHSNGAFIHHPAGDIKKISLENDPIIIYNATINWGGIFGTSQPNTHWRVNPDLGVFQPGSSGCPMFNAQRHIIGQLHGGVIVDSCNISASYFGRFNQSWDASTNPSARLKEWLDPTATNKITQNGYAQPVFSLYTISGKVETHWGVPIPRVKVVLTGPRPDSVLTDSLGRYSFRNLMSGFSYTVRPRPTDPDPLNGITTQDMSLISRHILTLEPLSTPWKILAADANGSGTVTTLDIVAIRRLILGIDEQFKFQPIWRFYRSNTNFANPLNPFIGTFLDEVTQFDNLQKNETGIDFYGVRIGDLNNSAGVGN